MKRFWSVRRAWILTVFGFSAVRAVVAWGLFNDYGLNPWVFAAVDVGTALPYATAIAELPSAVATSNRLDTLRYVAMAVGSFLAPYVYIWFAADDAPLNLRLGMVILAACLFGAAAIGLLRKANAARRAS